mmetsp:Transcript_50521/g.60927  ORF Transcript_50521/g.60927 Transcript_50521/m.60927 type:complete len:86 (-) Transcript_50521:17-274(-)
MLRGARQLSHGMTTHSSVSISDNAPLSCQKLLSGSMKDDCDNNSQQYLIRKNVHKHLTEIKSSNSGNYGTSSSDCSDDVIEENSQ